MYFLILIWLLLGRPPLTAELAEYLLGPDCDVVENRPGPDTCVMHPRLPVTLLFKKDSYSPSAGLFHALSLRYSMFDSDETAACKKKVKGVWACYPANAPFGYSCAFSEDIADFHYVFFQHRFFYRVSSCCGVMKINSYSFEEGFFKSLHEPEKHSLLLPHYMIVIHPSVAIGIRPVGWWDCPVVALCIKVK